MPKQVIKKKTNVNKKNTRARSRPVVQKQSLGVSRVLSKQESPAYKVACSLADPFSCTTCLPDGSDSACYSVKYMNTLSSSSTGSNVCFILTVDPVNNNYVGISSSSTTLVGASNMNSCASVTQIRSTFNRFRPVSAGVKASFIGPTTGDGGVLFMALVSPAVTPSQFNGLTLTAASALVMNFKTFPLRNGGTITWRPNDEEDMNEWRQIPGTSTSTAGAPYSPYMIVIAFNCAVNAPILQIEAINNFEGVYADTTFKPGNTQDRKKTEAGWYEKAKGFIADVSPIVMGVADVLAGSGLPVVSSVGSLIGLFGRTLGSNKMPKVKY